MANLYPSKLLLVNHLTQSQMKMASRQQAKITNSIFRLYRKLSPAAIQSLLNYDEMMKLKIKMVSSCCLQT